MPPRTRTATAIATHRERAGGASGSDDWTYGGWLAREIGGELRVPCGRGSTDGSTASGDRSVIGGNAGADGSGGGATIAGAPAATGAPTTGTSGSRAGAGTVGKVEIFFSVSGRGIGRGGSGGKSASVSGLTPDSGGVI